MLRMRFTKRAGTGCLGVRRAGLFSILPVLLVLAGAGSAQAQDMHQLTVDSVQSHCASCIPGIVSSPEISWANANGNFGAEILCPDTHGGQNVGCSESFPSGTDGRDPERVVL
jgi:hypothetical protein